MSAQVYYNYILVTESERYSYVGYTVNFTRRLRQHRKEIVGGAKFTRNMTTRGEHWVPLVVVTGCPTSTLALQFEFAQKQKVARFRKKQIDPAIHARIQKSTLHPRLKTLMQTLHMQRWTNAADQDVCAIPLQFHWPRREDYMAEWVSLLPPHLENANVFTGDINCIFRNH